jgi:hypothetical protein
LAVPPIGNVVTPANFILQSAQGAVLLSWSQAPLASTYYINRSTDGVTFTNIGQTASLSYTDTTGTVDTIYYYQIQASNGTNSSPTTVALTGLSLNPGQTTLANMRLEAQQRMDRIYFGNITTQEWNSMISQSYKELYDIIVQKFGDDYYSAVPYTYTTTGQIDPVYQAQVFPLPSDFYKLLGVEVALNPQDPNSWVTLKKFEFIQRNLWNFPNVYTFYGITNLRYRLNGNNLYIVPICSAGQTIRIWYAPRPSQLFNDTDIIDGISGYEEYVIADVCAKGMIKSEEDPGPFLLQKAALLKRIEDAAENRDIGEPERVSDSKTRNFAWSDSGGEFGSGSGMW